MHIYQKIKRRVGYIRLTTGMAGKELFFDREEDADEYFCSLCQRTALIGEEKQETLEDLLE